MKSAAVLKAEVEASLANRFSAPLTFRQRPVPDAVSTGLPEVDALIGGVPRGAITEITGPASSGRTSLALAVLAEATAREEVCAVVDASDAFDPESAAAAGLNLDRVLWVRCRGNAEHALKAADMLIQGGGFGFVLMDLGDVAPQTARRIPMTAWFRFRRAIENTPTVMIVLEREPSAKSCASLMLEMRSESVAWSGAPGCSRLLRGTVASVTPRKPVRSETARFRARALG